MMLARLLIPAALAAGLVFPGLAAAAPQPPSLVERGAQLAQDRCAACHGVALETRSPERNAPLFRVLSRLYSAKDLSTKLAEIAEHGHFEMPALSLREDQIEDVAAYIASLEGGDHPAAKPRPRRPRGRSL